ncbi:MAG TPA: adenosylcobinamide-GDP ribazoletransferase [Dyadobacter sp.]|nr:adenosylcobinamide-GDP ribazoletransferase [Dyadobacter sp.]
MKKQSTLFFVALQFYTRFPIPGWVSYSADSLSRATRFLPLIGWLVGLICGAVWLAGDHLLNMEIGLLMSMIFSVITTGAFHEDGFADVCDGFGGGWTKEKILMIMKDSRLGTYGVAGLVFMLSIKFLSLKYLGELANADFFILTLTLVSGHALSRMMAVTVIFTQPYARDSDDSKAKPVATATKKSTFVVASILAMVPFLGLIYFLKQPELLLSLLFLYIITVLMSRYFYKWIGGYTGDCLGAVQQVSEVSFYLFVAILWKFI